MTTFEETLKVMFIATALILLTALSMYTVLTVTYGAMELFGKVMLILFSST